MREQQKAYAEGHQPLASYSLKDLLACVDRELRMRRRTYPRWVDQAKLSQAQADDELARMQAVRDALLKGEAARLVVQALAGRCKAPPSQVARMLEEARSGLLLEDDNRGNA